MPQVLAPQQDSSSPRDLQNLQNLAQKLSSSSSCSSCNMQTGHPPAGAPPIKEELVEPPPGAQYLSARCVLFTYFHGDISREVDEHFSRALSTGTCMGPCTGGSRKALRDASFPMNQRSFPPSFWSSSFQSSLSHTDLSSFPGDAFSSSPLHGHDAWHHPHYSLGGAISSQSSTYPRSAPHNAYGSTFDPRYGSLLMPSVRPRLTTTSCDLGGKAESGMAWSSAFTGADVDSGLQTQDKPKDLYWF